MDLKILSAKKTLGFIGSAGIFSFVIYSCIKPSNVTIVISGGSSNSDTTTSCAASDFSSLSFSNNQTITDLLCQYSPFQATITGITVTSPSVPSICSDYTYSFTCNTSTSTFSDADIGTPPINYESFTLSPLGSIGGNESVSITAVTVASPSCCNASNTNIVLYCSAEASNGTNNFALTPLTLTFSGDCPT